MITRIPVEPRDNKLSNREVRDSELVPTIVYGPHFSPSKSMTVSHTALRQALEHRGSVFEITVNKKKYFVKLSELQTEPTSRTPIHVSLCELPKGSKIELKVPLQIQGDPSDRFPGATILMIRDSVTLVGKMNDLPETIDLNVSKLEPGENLRVSDLKIEGKFEIADKPDEVLVVCQHPHVQQATEPDTTEVPPEILSDSHLEESLR